MAMLITFVNFAVIRSSEHLASHCVFFIMNAYVVIEYVRKKLKAEQFKAIKEGEEQEHTSAMSFSYE